MKDESRRAGRLGVRSLTKKTADLFRGLASRAIHAPFNEAMFGAEEAQRPDKRLYESASSSETTFDPSVWSGGGAKLRRQETAPTTAMATAPAAPAMRTQHDQLQTKLFGALPAEVREMIYQELWRGSGLGQHIIRTEAGYAHASCVVYRPADHDEEGGEGDAPWGSMWMAPDPRGSVPLWYKREMSTWCDHWRCEEARELREIWRDIGRGRAACRCVEAESWTAFMPMMLTCKRMYSECVASIYRSLTFTITDIAVARNLFGLRRRGGLPPRHAPRRINLSFRRQVDEGSSFDEWVESWSAVLRLLDSPGLASVRLWLDSDVYYERHWLSAPANVLRRVPEALAHKVAVSLPPDGHRDRERGRGGAGPVWLRGLDEVPAPEAARGQQQQGAVCFGVRRVTG
ncbi:hypothetical protein CSOJ01_13619 [Colletotrichum sojae]|uniref:DUF7730 domain-containing protein n=1 Tax=Colletotrichum sojae TaxID=2175907 RepID=A0A8H6ISC1_9PEZI|nr:hypothetical protein CSOJ01_13619 [Colletotrichum sojae]